jgi:hypothetical protein
MDLLPLALIQSVDAVNARARSAQPGAPVVPEPARAPRLIGARRVAAGLLSRAARALEPKAAPECTPAH